LKQAVETADLIASFVTKSVNTVFLAVGASMALGPLGGVAALVASSALNVALYRGEQAAQLDALDPYEYD
jgi:hypothetical protein